MSFLSGGDWAGAGALEPRSGAGHVHEHKRRATTSGVLGTGTLACARCDAPIALARPVTVAVKLACPYCGHRAPAREFLSLRAPTRPNRVEVRVSFLGAG